MKSFVFSIVLLLLLITETADGLLWKNSKDKKSPPPESECCVPPKRNVNSQKANSGRRFLLQLSFPLLSPASMTAETMCNFMHFLYQQASINRLPVTVNEEMFVLFDPLNKILNRLLTVNDLRKSDRDSRRRGRRFSRRTQANSNEAYPVYIIDAPKSCLPGGFDHIIFGELSSTSSSNKYNGRRIFFKLRRFGLDRSQFSSARKSLNSLVQQMVRQTSCQLRTQRSKPECARQAAFEDNTDNEVLKRWLQILSNTPSKKGNYLNYKELATKNGIREIDQQSKDLEATSARISIRQFRRRLKSKYGEDDIGVRNGREIILSVTELAKCPLTCEAYGNVKRC